MLKYRGFSILEVMIAMAIMASLGLGVYRLQLSALAASQQTLVKQMMTQAANSMVNQMISHLNYTAATGSNRVIVGYDSASCSAASCYIESNFASDTASGTNCQGSDCTNQQYAKWTLYQWKQSLANMNLPVSNISAIVCADSAMGIPTASSPNCSNGSLVVKIVWTAHNMDAESAILGNNNYVMLKVPQR
ncbi:MAG: prepilin-type N-terminal cleavage/methylation domain-containing protein [Neisseriaceae bacterium]|nr:MAG: prepilin-type N-terminal cleavage/methylation domain-containing protein [Neisseriaceae bacterium]